MSPTSASTRRRAPPKVTEITGPPLDFEPNPYLLVDAGRTVAVRANAASIKEERTGTLTLYPLDGGKKRAVDLREVTGVDTLHPIGWAFDPTEAGLLRILDRSGRLFEWNVDEDTATEVDAVEVGKGFELAPYFNGADGMPLLRDKRTYEVEKGGDYTAGGAEVVKADRSACPGEDDAGPHRPGRQRYGVDRLPGRRQGRAVPEGRRGLDLDGRRGLRRRRTQGHPDADLGAADRRLTCHEGRRISRDPRGWRQIALRP